MALKLTPQQTKTVIDELNKDYKSDAAKAQIELSHFGESGYGANKVLKIEDLVGTIKKKLAKVKAPQELAAPKDAPVEAPEGEEQKDLFQEKGVSTLPAPGMLLDQLEKLMGAEKVQQFVSAYTVTSLDKRPKRGALVSIEGPDTKDIQVSAYLSGDPGFEKDDDKMPRFTSDLFKKLSPTDRNAIINKLAFKAKYDPKEGTLSTTVKVPKVFYNMTFDVNKFMQAGLKRVGREGAVVDQEELVEKLGQFFDKVSEREQEYMSTEEYMDGYSGYSRQDAEDKKLSDMLGYHTDDEIDTYVTRMKALGIPDEDIKDLLIECGEEEFNGGDENRIGSFTMGETEGQIDFDSYNQYEDDMKELGLPYPTLDENLAVLSEESAKKLSKEAGVKITWDPTIDGYSADSMYVYGSNNNSFDYIVDPDKFVYEARQRVKDKKRETLAGRGKKKKKAKEVKTASLDYPVVAALLEEG